MKTIILASAMGLSLLCCFFSSSIQAGDALDSLNIEVEQTAQNLDQQYGVLLTYSERANLKIGLIVARQKAQKETQPDKTVSTLVDEAIATYELFDPEEQRQLLIKMAVVEQPQKGTGNSGTEPPP